MIVAINAQLFAPARHETKFMMPMRPRVVLGFLFAMAIILSACAAEPGTGQVEIEPQDPERVASGERLYAANCAECHGADLRGTDKGPSHLSEVYVPSHHGDFAFILAVDQGSRAHHWNFGDMAPVEGLTLDEIATIVAFVRERQRLEGFEPYPP